MSSLSHLDPDGNARMVDVGAKAPTARRARARCEIKMKPGTLRLLLEGRLKKGDALTVAKTAGILAAKRTGELIPMCHPLALEHVEIRFSASGGSGGGLVIESEVKVTGKTGVEMEALTAVTVAALAIYDMAKSHDPAMIISKVYLMQKTGGKSDYAYKGGSSHGQ